jgi:uncharacterized protein YndB with AHSA1/START domain
MGQRYGGPLMTLVRTSVEVDAPIEGVWEVVSDPRNLPRWDSHITSVIGVPEEGLAEGSAYSTDLRLMGLRSKVDAVAEKLEPPVFARIRLSGILDATVTTVLTPLKDGRTRLTQEVDYTFRGGRLGELAGRALRLTGGPRLALRRGVLAQKRQAENRR